MEGVVIKDELKQVIFKVLKLDGFELIPETHAFEVPGWDSLNHLNIISAIEEKFKIRIKGGELMRLKNIGDLQVLVDKKVAAKQFEG